MIHNSIIPGDGGAVLSESPKWKEGNLSTDFDIGFTMAYGAGKFVAMQHAEARCVYSTDGINWTETTMPTAMKCYSTCYGKGKFVTVGVANDGTTTSIAAYSTDGITWTQTTLPVSAFWQSVCYGAGKFVAAATNGVAVYSTDGINWTQVSMPSDYGATRCAYGAGKFVAISYNTSATKAEQMAYSTDGITWTNHTSDLLLGQSLARIRYGNGMFVATSADNTLKYTNNAVYSTDGINWAESTLPVKARWRELCYGAGMFILTAYKDESNNPATFMAYSTDGITWKLASGLKAKKRQAIAYGGGKFVVCTENQGNEYLEPTCKELA